MANLLNTIPEGKFNQNLYPNTKMTYSIIGSPGSTLTYNDFSVNSDQSLRLSAVTTAETVLDLGESITIPYTGPHAFSFYLYKNNTSLDWQVTVEVYKGGVLFQTYGADVYSSASNFVDGNWNVYGQSFQYTAGDVVTFRLKIATGTTGHNLYISAPKFEHLNKSFFEPSYYTYPNNFFSKANDLHISETQWDVTTITPTTVTNGASLNLLTLIDNSSDKNLINSDEYDQLDVVSNSIKTTYRNGKIIHLIRVLFNISAGSDQHYQIQIRRTLDDSVVYRSMCERNPDESIQTIEMTTRTLSDTDPFTIDGFYIAFVNNSGANADLSGSLSLVVISTYQKSQPQ